MSNVNGLYVGGNSQDDKLYVAKLDDKNNTFSPSTLTGTPSGDGINSMAVYNGELYIGGNSILSYLAKLDNNTNIFGKNLITDFNIGIINAMTVYNKKLYLGGGGAVAVYDGKFLPPELFIYNGIPDKSTPNKIHVMTSYNDSLYIGGNYTSTDGGTYNLYVAKLDDKNKTFTSITFPDGAPTSGNYGDTGIWSMAVYKETLYIGGAICNKKATEVTCTPYLAKLDNNTFGTNLITQQKDKTLLDIEFINAMIQYKDTLYLGSEGGVVTYDGKEFSPVVSTSVINSMTIYNGELYASGIQGDVIKLNNNNKWTTISKDQSYISSMIDYHPDVLHADQSGLRIYKKNY